MQSITIENSLYVGSQNARFFVNDAVRLQLSDGTSISGIISNLTISLLWSKMKMEPKPQSILGILWVALRKCLKRSNAAYIKKYSEKGFGYEKGKNCVRIMWILPPFEQLRQLPKCNSRQ